MMTEQCFFAFIRNRLGTIFLITSLILPIAILYVLHPDTFQLVWEARTPYVIFLWFFGLELVLSWTTLTSTLQLDQKLRMAFTLLSTALPTTFVLATSFLGLHDAIIALGKGLGVPYVTFGTWFIDVSWPISVEYLVFTALFTVNLLAIYGMEHLKRFLISAFFLWSTTVFFLLNTFAPYGTIGVLQAFVPLTTNAAAYVLEGIGYQTAVSTMTNGRGPGMMLSVIGESSAYTAIVYWPSAGIQSLIIYTGIMLLFIKDTQHSLRRKATYFVVGVLGTFIVNIGRIVTIMIIGLRIGRLEASVFHDYYGELFFIAWMTLYFVLIAYGSHIINRTKQYLESR
jgi:thaumarchaeosortase